MVDASFAPALFFVGFMLESISRLANLSKPAWVALRPYERRHSDLSHKRFFLKKSVCPALRQPISRQDPLKRQSCGKSFESGKNFNGCSKSLQQSAFGLIDRINRIIPALYINVGLSFFQESHRIDFWK